MNNNAHFTGLIIPNVYRPFGHSYYNSFIATFWHQVTNNEWPKIKVDGTVKLIYVGELVHEFCKNKKLYRYALNETQSNSVKKLIT